MFMEKIRTVIGDLKGARKSLTATKRELQNTLNQTRSELMEINALPHCIEDQISAWDDEVDSQDKALRDNIKNYYLNVSTVYLNEAVFTSPKSLEVFLRRFGARGERSRDPFIGYIMAAGSWRNLRKIALEELNKLNKENFGTMTMAERMKKQEKAKAQIEELTASLKELDSAD